MATIAVQKNSMFDWIVNHLVEIGTTGSSIVGGAIAIYGFLQRSEVKDFFRTKIQVGMEIDQLKKNLEQAEREIASAHNLAKDWQGSVDAMKIRFDSMELEVGDLKTKLQDYEVTKHKFDAMYEWTKLIIDSWFELQACAKKGMDVSKVIFPPIPPLLHDKFQIPESLR